MNGAANNSAMAARQWLEETEDGITSTAILRHRSSLTPPATSIDVLEVIDHTEPLVRWQEGLDHEGLLKRFPEV